jgi:L-ascorbate metabolism protein UlaG (beta-lactamase superfamily)
MQITWNGHSSFKIITKTPSGEVTLITDPFSKEIGFKFPKSSADIVTVSHDHYDHNNASEISGEPFVITRPGEYEVKGIFVYGFNTFHDEKNGAERGKNTIYTMQLIDEGISLAHLGDLGHVLSNKDLENLEKIDILFVPVGGTYSLNAKQAVEVINQIEPRIVIPMHYKTPDLKIDLASVDAFCKELGACTEKTSKFKIAKKDLPQEDMKIVVMER